MRAIRKGRSNKNNLERRTRRNLLGPRFAIGHCAPPGGARSLEASRATEFGDAVALMMSTGKKRSAFLERMRKRGAADQLNRADCLSYACAKAAGARLLFKGEDFAKTDVNDAWQASRKPSPR